METLKKSLRNSLRDTKRIALLGIGSELRGDDAAGILVARHIKGWLSRTGLQRKFKVFIGDTAPENLTGEIKKFKPQYLLIVDSADTGKRAGTIKLIKPQDSSGVTFCTHQLPLKIMVDYIIESIGCQVTIIGIQPKAMSFGEAPSKEIEKSARRVSGMIKGIVKKL